MVLYWHVFRCFENSVCFCPEKSFLPFSYRTILLQMKIHSKHLQTLIFFKWTRECNSQRFLICRTLVKAGKSVIASKTTTSQSKAIRSLDLPSVKSYKPDPSTVTTENQHAKLAETMTPFYNIPYEKQLVIKYRQCEKILRYLGAEIIHTNPYLRLNHKKLPCNLESVRASPVTTFYRNKDEFSFGQGVDQKTKVLGFYVGNQKTGSIVCVEPTYLNILKPDHVKVAQLFQDYVQASPLDIWSSKDFGGYWRNVVVKSNRNGDIMVVAIMHPQQLTTVEVEEEKKRLKHFFVEGPVQGCNVKSLYFQTCRHLRCSHQVSPFQLLHGQPKITESAGDIQMSVSPGTFVQGNPWAAEVLYETIAQVSKLTQNTTVIDLGCGAGAISLFLAKNVQQCVGIEQFPESVEDAKLNKELNGIENVSFFEGQASKVFSDIVSSLYAQDLVVVANPSRGGLSESEVNSLRMCRHLGRIVYVSCKPAGNAFRNFVQLCQGKQHGRLGRPFVPTRAVPVDMFPQTDHCELIIVFERSLQQHL